MVMVLCFFDVGEVATAGSAEEAQVPPTVSLLSRLVVVVVVALRL